MQKMIKIVWVAKSQNYPIRLDDTEQSSAGSGSGSGSFCRSGGISSVKNLK